MRRRGPSLWLFGCLLVRLVAPNASEAADAPGVTFFEQKIRPVLVKECYSCHSAEAKRVQGGLRLDSRADMLEGGDSGPAVVPGSPAESSLIDAIRHDGIAMPPKGKLSEQVVADFSRWVEMGAPDPRTERRAPARKGINLETGRQFWAYQPPKAHEAPAVKRADWPRGDVDRFVLAAMEGKGLAPSAPADRAELARRVYFDLAGLPPTSEEIDAFVNDGSSDAYEKLVDRLLASPRFGERWGRHWLDVARFAESLTLRGFIFKEAWRYRDYVIDAFNADRPFDRFVQEQIAGDLLSAPNLAERRKQLVAVTFLMLGNSNLEEQDKRQLVMDVIDEQIDTIGKGILAQTIACARCHDHKFDPIPTRDYYALAGILKNIKALEHANVSKWLERALPVPEAEEVVLKAHEAAVAVLEKKIKAERERSGPLAKAATRQVIAASDLPGIVVDDTQARRVGEWEVSTSTKRYIGEGYLHDHGNGKGEKTLTFQPELPESGAYEVWLAYSSSPTRARAVPVTIMSADGEKLKEVDMSAQPAIADRFTSLGKFNFERNGQGYVLIANEGTKGVVTADAVVFVPAALLRGGDGTERLDAFRKLENELKALKASGPKQEMVMTVEEQPKIAEGQVLIRGSLANPGDSVARGFLQVAMAAGKPPALPSHESGRRELAAWMASRENPLTARVIVNRAWQWLFGSGLVRTCDNFGTTGELPSHPELLDDLAVRFMNDGWSMKRLVRTLVLSRTYQMASRDDARARGVDPENRLFWRMNRRRLDAECLRDAMLAVSGGLEHSDGGLTFPVELAADYGFRDTGRRRSVYVPAFRNSLPELFEVFDFADPSMVVGRRNVSTVAPQALYLMNHPFVVEQSRQSARRVLALEGLDDEARVERAYRLALGRMPTERERTIGVSFIKRGGNAAAEREETWAILFQGLFASGDFRYVN